MTIEESGELLWIPAIVRFANQAVDTQTAYKVEIRFFIPSEQLRNHIKIRVNHSGSVQKRDANMKWGRVAVVDTDAVEYICKRLYVLCHVFPKPWVVVWRGAIPKLDAVSPYNHFTA